MSRKHPKTRNPNTAADQFSGWLLAGMTALLVARPWFPSEAAAQGDGLPLVMLWLALAVLCLLAGIGNRRLTIRFGPVDGAVAMLVAWQCVAALHAVHYGSPRPAWNMLWEWIALGMVFFLARHLIRNAHDARAVVAAMIALAAGISAYGIYQWAIELPALQRQFAADPEGMLHAIGVNYPPGTPLRGLLESRLKNPEPMATFAITNSLAAALAPWLVMGLGSAALTWRERRRTIAWLLCLAPIGICLLLTKSRSGYVAVVVGVVCLVAPRLRFRLRWVAVPALLAGLLAVAVMVASFGKSAAATSLGYRVQYWQATLKMIADRPLFGCGPGNFQDVYTQYKLSEASEEVCDPHDFLLEVWATAGTPALLALMAALGLFGFSAFHPRENQEVLSPLLNPSLPRAWWFVLGGLIGGFLLAALMLLGQIVSAPPSPMAIVIGLPVAVLCMCLLVPWVRDGGFPPAIIAGVAVLLVDLLTTGGIGMPSIAQSLWLLLALGCVAGWTWQAPRFVVAMLLAIAVGLMAVCYQTSYARVLACQSHLRVARTEYLDDHRQAARELAERAVAADPLSSDAHAFLAELCLDAWLADLQPADFDAFAREDALARRTAPQAAPIWRSSAERYRRAFLKTDASGRNLQPEAIHQAVAIARWTTVLYPGNPVDHAALALIYQLSGDEAAYRREARAALELDRSMPHEDKKLPDAVRKKLEVLSL